MFTRPKQCPNPKCCATGDFYSYNGEFKTKWNAQPVPRYNCNKCGMEFSSHSLRTTKGQHRPDLNYEIMQWLCSGVSINKIAKNLRISKTTVLAKIGWLAKESDKFHRKVLSDGLLQSSYFQIDEMETHEQTKLKPLSVALAVRVKTGEIVDAEVATMNAKSNAETSRRKYGWRLDTRQEAIKSILYSIQKCRRPGERITIGCDGKKDYKSLILSIIPDANISVFTSPKDVRGEPKKHDPLFTINHLCAAIRADLSVFARQSWASAQSPGHLQDLLLIYTAWVNKYPICDMTNTVAPPKPPKKTKRSKKSMKK